MAVSKISPAEVVNTLSNAYDVLRELTSAHPKLTHYAKWLGGGLVGIAFGVYLAGRTIHYRKFTEEYDSNGRPKITFEEYHSFPTFGIGFGNNQQPLPQQIDISRLREAPRQIDKNRLLEAPK